MVALVCISASGPRAISRSTRSARARCDHSASPALPGRAAKAADLTLPYAGRAHCQSASEKRREILRLMVFLPSLDGLDRAVGIQANVSSLLDRLTAVGHGLRDLGGLQSSILVETGTTATAERFVPKRSNVARNPVDGFNVGSSHNSVITARSSPMGCRVASSAEGS